MKTNRPETDDFAINIILDESDAPNSKFIDIENDDGYSIDIGIRKGVDGFTRLRITRDDLISHFNIDQPQQED